MALPTDSWNRDGTLYATIFNATHYPTIKLQIREATRQIRRRKDACDRSVENLIQDEKHSMNELKRAYKRGASREELKHYSTGISGIRARRRLQLQYRNQYQQALQEIESLQSFRDQSQQVRELSTITRRIDASLPAPIARNLVRNYAKTKDSIRTTSEQITEALEEEDAEYDNKVHDADQLLDMYLDELGLQVGEVRVPPGKPQAQKGNNADAARDAEMLERLNAL
jgi:hypothetical protein